jgi:DNA-binding response OmpR family regulator
MTEDKAKWVRDLQDEIETLKRQLREVTGSGDTNHRWDMLGLTPSEERILRVLLVRDFAPHDALHTAVYWDKRDNGADATIKVFIAHLRKKLPFLRPWIKCLSGRGYALHYEGKHRLLFELMNPKELRP